MLPWAAQGAKDDGLVWRSLGRHADKQLVPRVRTRFSYPSAHHARFDVGRDSKTTNENKINTLRIQQLWIFSMLWNYSSTFATVHWRSRSTKKCVRNVCRTNIFINNYTTCACCFELQFGLNFKLQQVIILIHTVVFRCLANCWTVPRRDLCSVCCSSNKRLQQCRTATTCKRKNNFQFQNHIKDASVQSWIWCLIDRCEH